MLSILCLICDLRSRNAILDIIIPNQANISTLNQVTTAPVSRLGELLGEGV